MLPEQRTRTRIGKNPADELGAAEHRHQPVGTHLLPFAGADIHDVRAADYETMFSGQRLFQYHCPPTSERRVRRSPVHPAGLDPEPSAKVPHFSNFDANQYNTATHPLSCRS